MSARAPAKGEFCHRHFSWLCQAGQGKCQAEAAAEDLRRAGLLVAETGTKLTRAAKERAVAEMALRLTVTSCKYDRSRGTPMIEDHARAMRRQHKALVRLAMARTVEDGTR